jgi:aryl-alcohol dehydrogenase-like predicted oxidoreductase
MSSRGATRMVSMQNHYNLLYREEEREMIPLCVDEGVGILPWSPLARGYLTRRPQQKEATSRGEDDYAKQLYNRPGSDEITDAVCYLAEARSVKPAQIALAWLLSKPYVSAPIVGATKLSHLEDAVGALELSLTDEDRQARSRLHPAAGAGASLGASTPSSKR